MKSCSLVELKTTGPVDTEESSTHIQAARLALALISLDII